MKDGFKDIIKKASGRNRRMIVPMCAEDDIEPVLTAAGKGIIHPVFVGGINTGAKSFHMIQEFESIISGSPEETLSIAVDMLKKGEADIMIQGGIDTSLFLSSILDPKTGLLPSRRASHACVFFFPGRKTPVIITDTFIHDHPSLMEKQVIIENSVSLWNMLGNKPPKIAALAVLEYVNPKIHSTLDSAILSKMAERRQLGNVTIEGPLDIDCALSKIAAERKGVKSPVSGDTDIYLVHDVESGYLFAEHLVFIGGLVCSGVALGVSKQIVLNLPFMCRKGQLASIALAALLSEAGK